MGFFYHLKDVKEDGNLKQRIAPLVVSNMDFFRRYLVILDFGGLAIVMTTMIILVRMPFLQSFAEGFETSIRTLRRVRARNREFDLFVTINEADSKRRLEDLLSSSAQRCTHLVHADMSHSQRYIETLLWVSLQCPNFATALRSCSAFTRESKCHARLWKRRIHFSVNFPVRLSLQ